MRNFHPPAGRFEGVIGGPPCQSFSPLANLVRAKGYEPRFGNLIPEFERVVAEAGPEWFLMEEVPQAPAAQVPGYAVHAFRLDNSSLDSGDGLGHEQERLRLFSFGVRGATAIDLRAHIQLAALRLPRAGTVTTTHVNNSDEAKGRVRRQCAIDPRAVPVAVGGSGKRKPGARVPAVHSSGGAGGERERVPAVVGAHSGAAGRPNGGHLVVYQWREMLRLQGLPPDFLELAPFTVEGKRKAVANGVPLFMGRALARAITAALAARQEQSA